jgi:hypothetical protein
MQDFYTLWWAVEVVNSVTVVVNQQSYNSSPQCCKCCVVDGGDVNIAHHQTYFTSLIGIL